MLRHLGKDTIQTMAFSGEKRYNDYWGIGFSPKARPTKYLAVFDGQQMFRRQKKILDISSAKSSLSDMCVFLNLLSWPISKGDFSWIRDEGEVTNFIPVMLDSEWEIGARHDGKSLIHLSEVERGRSLVLDASKEYALIQMDIPASLSGAGFGHSIRRFKDYRKLNGSWFPFEINVETEVYKFETEEVAGTMHMQLKVSDLKINGDVPESIFHVGPRPGEFIHNRITGEAYRSTEKANTIESVVASLQQKQAALARQHRWPKFELQLLGFALAGLLGGWALTTWSKK